MHPKLLCFPDSIIPNDSAVDLRYPYFSDDVFRYVLVVRHMGLNFKAQDREMRLDRRFFRGEFSVSTCAPQKSAARVAYNIVSKAL